MDANHTMTEIISIANQKGGVGKTTTAVNLGACLAVMGYRVMLVDLDPKDQIAESFGFSKYDIRVGWYDLFSTRNNFESAIQSTDIQNLDFIPANLWSEHEDRMEFSREVLSRFLTESLVLLNPGYDFVLIDCPPSLGLLTSAALMVSDSLLVPIQCEFYALKSLGKLLKLTRRIKEEANAKLQYRGFLITMVDSRSNCCLRTIDKLRYALDNMVLETMIPRNIKLAECAFYGKPIISVNPNGKGAQSYLALARELLHQNGTVESLLAKEEFATA